jgi:hypothetical protein
MAESIRVGDRTIDVAQFSAFKFLEATDLLANILEASDSLDDEMVKLAESWRKTSPPRTMNRATAALELDPDEYEAISDEAWEKSGGEITLTPRPQGARIGLRLFPKLYKHGRRDFENLIALIATPNSELDQAEENGTDLYAPGGPVHRNRRHILHGGSPSQMVKLGVAALDVLGEELREGQLADAVGKLVGRWTEMTGRQPATGPTGASGNDAPASSTSSSPPTRARSRAKKSSTASPTAS